ncbi:UPF0014-domain-containing protein [Tilletiaria anomala UBC 951]|uniref:UPF0014-domain-containing protein n=1 Tax=Tilletiaria anomala (strain ATCC 24038 / CBS 436.72 / UBC 951) TaxID=1037660 RepID=A0A066WJ21_TILAU|nr:UPF0014-domain-containing protein [Tilletiaria anomala UBC 951]KDN52553.1 UPF0014-domain-containing protein [Tilletiaria anomala UBC 951]
MSQAGDPLTPSPGQHLTWANVLIAFCFLLIDALLSIYFKLGISRSLLIAAARCAVQLYIMSLVLDRIFAANSLWAVALMALVLNLLAASEVTLNKAKYRYEGMFTVTLTSMIMGCVPCFAVASRFALSQDPWWAPSKFIPALGMALGNAISGVTIATSYTLEQLNSNRDKVETYLAHGATRFEACRPVATDALRLALTPIINQMPVIGLISLPGMFTGAVLGGADVDTAAKLQMIIIFCLSASTAFASLSACIATCGIMVDARGRIRPERAWSAKDGRPTPRVVRQPASSAAAAGDDPAAGALLGVQAQAMWYGIPEAWRRWRRQGNVQLR